MDKWLERGKDLPDGSKIKKHLSSDSQWQLYSTSCEGFVLAVNESLVKQWESDNFGIINLFDKIDDIYLLVDNGGTVISSLEHGPFLDNYDDCMLFAASYRKALENHKEVLFNGGIYIEKYSMVLPTYSAGREDIKTVLGKYLTSGVNVSTDDFDKLCRFMSWLHPSLVANIIKAAGFSEIDGDAIVLVDEKNKEVYQEIGLVSHRHNVPHGANDRFLLPGRPELEDFFNEHVVDIVLNAEKYKRVGIGFPSPIVLFGEPGCGKTFAVNKLIDFLGWPSYHMDSGSIGSPYIHDTSKKIAEVFDAAMNNAPSVIVIDEMEAFLTDRGISQNSGQHHVEEVAEFLRKIPEANEKNVLIIAMTNMIECIDKAILRRGRFDNIIEIKMPSKEEIKSLLEIEINKLPVYDDVDIDAIAERLAWHPMSDVTYVLKEAGRMAVKNNCEVINQHMFMLACDAIDGGRSAKKHTIGFST